MKLIGLTGSIGAGKSVVSRILRLKGIAVYDCDSRARYLMEGSEEIKDALRARWGGECLDDNGHLVRSYIASRVFDNNEERLWLNSLVHSAVRKDILEWRKNRDLAFVESAILATSGLDRMCDRIWVIDVPEETRICRAMRRGGIPEESIRQRNEAQRMEIGSLPAGKVSVIDNSDGAYLLESIDTLLRGLHDEVG